MCYLHMQAAHMEVMRFSHSRARGSKVVLGVVGKFGSLGAWKLGKFLVPDCGMFCRCLYQ